jgi:lysophospholipase L1-like esterase
MATASLTTSPTTIDSGTSDNVSVTNAGTTSVVVSRGSQSATLQPGQGTVVYPEGTAVTAATVSGTGSVSYTATAARQSQAVQYAADPAFTGAYASRALTTVGPRLRQAASDAAAVARVVGTPMSTPPTITYQVSDPDSGVATGWKFNDTAARQAALRFIGGTPLTAFGNHYRFPAVTLPTGTGNVSATQSANGWAVEFMTDAPDVKVKIATSSSTNGLIAEVDGQPVTASPTAHPSSSGFAYYLMQFSVGSATIVASTGVFTTPTAHGLQVGDAVVLGTLTTTTGVTAGATYFVRTAPTNATFTLAASPGGSAVSLTGDGSTTSVCKAGARRIRVEGDAATGFDGVYVRTPYTVWARRTVAGIVAAHVGDSLVAQTNVARPNGGWSHTVAKILGWDNMVQVGLGGTGFTNAGTNASTYGNAQRIADTVAVNPDIVLFSASSNDDGQASATVQAAVVSALTAYRAALPNAVFVVDGAWPGSTGPSAARLTTEAAVKAGVATFADANTWFIDIANDPAGAWVSGTGKTTAMSGTGNADIYIGSDGTHPVQIGYDYKARRWVSAFRQSVLPNIK